MEKTRISINTFDDLLSQEKKIIEIINEMPNGGNLFMAHPFKLLEDMGIHLSEELIQEIKSREPYESGFSEDSYNAILRSTVKQTIHFHLSGLFRREPMNRREN